jgi:hypothetical protein
MDCPRTGKAAASGLRPTQPSSERDVESGGDLAILASGDGIDPSLVGRPCAALS